MVGGAGRPLKAALGRADLLRALAARGESGLAEAARLLGYRERLSRPVAEPTLPKISSEQAPEAPVRSQLAPVPLWRLEAVEELEEPEAGEEEGEALRPEDLDPRGQAPTAAPIVSWPRLWPALREALRSAAASRKLDAAELVRRWSRGEMVERLPRVCGLGWSRRLTLLVDRSQRLMPFWGDQDELIRRLKRQVGGASLRVLSSLDGVDGRWRGSRGRGRRETQPAAGETVLAVSDLGSYGGEEERASWAGFARALTRRGVRVRALAPCPAARWQEVVARRWRAIDWTEPMRTAARSGQRPDEAALRVRCERLLQLVSPAVRIEPGLLRAVRRLLPAKLADAGTEADVWSHPEVDGSSSVALRLPDSGPWREGFQHQPVALRSAVIAELRCWHAALPREIWLEEALSLAAASDDALAAEDAAAARRFALAASRTLTRSGATAKAYKSAVERWFLRYGSRLPAAVWRDGRLRAPLARAWGVASRDEPERQLPPGLTPGDLGGPAPARPQRWTAWQTGASLCWLPAQDSPPAEAPGSPLVTLLAARPEVAVAADTIGLQNLVELPSAEWPCPPPRTQALVLTTDRGRAELLRFVRPEWASGAGRDRFGLWLAVKVEDVTMRLRWIPPGRFLMGSPKSEAGRWEDEVQHQVTLSRGYWLGETPCTQAFWKAVTGKNPSEFQASDRPVEKVSWEDCKEFLQALNHRTPGLEARLPSEAEWERACRAGSTMSTYAGELEILGENNAPRLDQIAWYGGNSGVGFELEKGWDSSGWHEKEQEHEKAGSRPVALKEPNAWGLYDMLGNVWEWCEDRWDGNSPYSSDSVQDPLGRMGSARVLRGGSWSDRVRFVRAAARYTDAPGHRDGHLGFRLARGQEGGALSVEPAKERGGKATLEQGVGHAGDTGSKVSEFKGERW